LPERSALTLDADHIVREQSHAHQLANPQSTQSPAAAVKITGVGSRRGAPIRQTSLPTARHLPGFQKGDDGDTFAL
jgi:hypothetical protein